LGFILVAVLLGHSFATTEPAVIERAITKTFPAAPGGVFHLETGGGKIDLQSSSTDKVVTIHAKEKIHADNEANADEILKRLTLSFAQQGNNIVARAKYEGARSLFHSGSWPPVQVDFVVSVPASFSVELDSGGGRVTVGDLAGPVRARTGGGELNLGRISGEVEASTGGGSVRIESVANTLRASTGGGSLRAVISGALKGDSEVQTSGGSIHLTVDRTAAFTLDAVASGSNVDIYGLPITVAVGGPGRGQLAGSVNGGGPLLKLRSSNGSIEVLTR
jgi:hypothetical protein